MTSRILYLVGGAPRVGKSALAQRLLQSDGIPWLPTDVIRTALRFVVPEIDTVDQDPVDAAQLADVMYPHVETVAEVCAEEADRFLIEGFEVSTTYPARLRMALGGISVRSCFLGNCTYSADDLAAYRGPKPQHESEASRTELEEAAAWIRQRSGQLRDDCRQQGLPYVDAGELGFHSAMTQARGHLLGPTNASVKVGTSLESPCLASTSRPSVAEMPRTEDQRDPLLVRATKSMAVAVSFVPCSSCSAICFRPHSTGSTYPKRPNDYDAASAWPQVVGPDVAGLSTPAAATVLL
jgi:hypothetical protein